jgi:hypothetical protein
MKTLGQRRVILAVLFSRHRERQRSDPDEG